MLLLHDVAFHDVLRYPNSAQCSPLAVESVVDLEAVRGEWVSGVRSGGGREFSQTSVGVKIISFSWEFRRKKMLANQSN